MEIYNIGDKVWHASRKSTEETVTCPECFGKRYLTVILGDDSQVTIDCTGCASGYDPPKGYVTYYKQDVDVKTVIIDGMRITRDYVEYEINKTSCSCNIIKGSDLFPIKEAAEVRAKELADAWNKEQLAKLHRKEKNHRDWSWHVHYYRRQIRDAEKTIEYATKKLEAAKTHVKKKEVKDGI